MAYIQLGTFKLKAGVPEEALLKAERAIQNGRICQQHGYLGRELARGENGEWMVIMRWESAADGEAWSPIFRQDPQAHALMEAMDLNTMRQQHFTVVSV